MAFTSLAMNADMDGKGRYPPPREEASLQTPRTLVLVPLNSLKLWSTYPPQRYSMFDSGKNNEQHDHHHHLPLFPSAGRMTVTVTCKVFGLW